MAPAPRHCHCLPIRYADYATPLLLHCCYHYAIRCHSDDAVILPCQLAATPATPPLSLRAVTLSIRHIDIAARRRRHCLIMLRSPPPPPYLRHTPLPPTLPPYAGDDGHCHTLPHTYATTISPPLLATIRHIDTGAMILHMSLRHSHMLSRLLHC